MSPETLRQKRRQLGLSLAALSAKAPASRWRLIEFELGNIELRPEEVLRIEAALRKYSREKIAALSGLAEAI
jgi:predicted transcriptional regulator